MFKNKVGRPSNEVIKKRRILNIVLIAIIFVVLFSLTYMLTNITTNRLKGGAPTYYGISCEEQTACYQAGFRNGNLYQRVIDRYNSENNASLSYNDVITDEQLLSITRLSADEGSIDDATGIEKLVNLEELYLEDNNLTSIGVSSLTKLETIMLSGNNLSEIDLRYNFNLIKLDLSYNYELKNINFGDMCRIEKLNLENVYNFENVDLNSCNNLEKLYGVYYPSIINNNPEIYYELSEMSMIIPLSKGDEFDLANLGITDDISNHMDIGDENALSIENNKLIANDVTASNFEITGERDIILNIIVHDNLESNKYYIDNHNGYIYINGNDNESEIINNIHTENALQEIFMCRDCGYNYNFENNKLIMRIYLVDDGEEMYIPLKSFTIGRIDLSSYEVNEKEITVNEVFNYEEVPHDNVELEYINNTLIVKDLNGNEVDRYTVNVRKSNETPNSNDGDEINEVEESTTNNIATEKEDITSKKTTLNKFENNAKTYDDIVKYFIIGGIAIILIVSIIIYKGKKK